MNISSSPVHIKLGVVDWWRREALLGWGEEEKTEVDWWSREALLGWGEE